MSNSNKGYSRNSGTKQSLSENITASRNATKGLSPKQTGDNYLIASPTKNMRATQNLSLAKTSGEPSTVTDLITSLNQKPRVSLLQNNNRTRNGGV